MMEKETPKQIPPAEMWDRFVVNQMAKVLTPKGYKKVIGGKVEVANRDFLSKQDCNMTYTMAANMIRMFRELVVEKVEEQIEVIKKELHKNTENVIASEKALSEAGLLEFSAKEGLKERIGVMRSRIVGLEAQLMVTTEILATIDKIVPAVPKKAQKAASQKIEVVKPGDAKINGVKLRVAE